MTIETKKVASVNEAIEIINRLNYRNDTFEYCSTTREDDADIKYRHFDAYRQNGEKDSFAITEIVVNGKLEIVRFFNLFRDIVVDLKLGDFNPDYYRFDEVINADDANLTTAKAEKQIAKFEEGKTYFNIWNQEDGRPHMRHYTIVKRTPKTIVLKSGYRCRIFTNDNGVEVAKVAYGTYIYASDLCTVEAEIEAANTNKVAVKKVAKKNYTVNPVIDENTPVKFNHVNLYLNNNGTLKLDCFFLCKNIETAYRRFRKIMTQAAHEIPELKGWDNWLAADKITEGENGYYFNENGDMIFTPPTGDNSFSVDINEDTFYFWGTFPDAFEVATIEVIAETDGSEDDPDDNNEVFNYLPAIADLNDVDTTQTKDEIKDAADQMGLMQLNRKIADLEDQLNGNRLAASALLDELDAETTLAEEEDIKYRYFEHAAISDALIDEKAIYTAAKSTRQIEIAALQNLMRKNENAVVEEIKVDDTEQNEVYALEAEMDARLADGKEIWTNEDIAAYYKACQIRVKKIKTRLAEKISDEERAKLLLEFETGYPVEYEEYKLESMPEPPADEFTAELAKLKTAANDAYATLIKAQEVHEQAKNALKNFLNDTAFKLKQKLDELPLDYTITLKKISGSTYRVADFSEIYIGAYHIGCDVEFRFENWAGRIIVRYDTPAQVETVINQLKAAIERGDKEFTFPTVDELNTPPKMPPMEPENDNSASTIDKLKIKLGRLYRHKALLTKAEFEHMERKLTADIAQLDKLTAAEKIAADETAKPETTEIDAKAIFDRVVTTRKHGIKHVVNSQGRHMWYYYGKLIKKDFAAELLADEGFTIEEYLAAEKTAEDYWRNVELPRLIAVDNQATFLEDKHWREVKTYDEKLTANVMPAEIDDSEDELIDPPEPEKADIHDSLAWAMKIALLKVQDFCREHNLKVAQNELSLYNICSNAMRELRTRVHKRLSKV